MSHTNVLLVSAEPDDHAAVGAAFEAIRGQPYRMETVGTLADALAAKPVILPLDAVVEFGSPQMVAMSGTAHTLASTLDASGISSFDVSNTHADRPLRVLVTLGGGVRLCDPAKVLATATPDGCPT